jgi:hypothetical protein
MRGSLGFPTLVFVVTSVACGRNAPLPTANTGMGVGGMHPTSGASGLGGSTSGSGTAGTSPVGPIGQGGVSGGAGIEACGAPTLPNGKCVPGAFKQNGGACECHEGWPCVCPGVGCVDPMLDADNCGTCGVHCGPTSTCNNGVCGPAPVMVSAAIAGCNEARIGPPIFAISEMTLTATDAVYFADAVHGTVSKVGAVTPLAMNEMGATMIQQVGANLFWYAYGAKKIRKMATSGGAVTDVYSVTLTDGGAQPDVAGFLVTPDGVTIYISVGNQVLEAPVAGGATSVVANDVHGGLPGALALNGTTNIVYPVKIDGYVDAPLLAAMPATCGMVGPMGGPIQTTCPWLASSQGELLTNFIAVVAGHVYWVDGPNLNGELIGKVGARWDQIAASRTSRISAAAATTDAIYFADSDWDPNNPNGFIEKTPLAPSSTPTLLARGQSSPIAIAVDATKVYWATSDCAIMSQNR